MKFSVSVRQLAEFVHQRGDLYPPLDGRTRAEEGIETQRLIQQRRGSDYERERSVSAVLSVADVELEISGRVDGLVLQRFEVEELKTSRADPQLAEQHLGSAHWAQLQLYAALLARDIESERWTLQLTYCNPDDLQETRFHRELSTGELSHFLQQTVISYVDWQLEQAAYRSVRDKWLNAREFPFGRFREHQQAMARRVFKAFRDGEQLLLEAPTGSGKTLGILYPATKALAAGHIARLFYMTSRSTGALAARGACELLAGSAAAPLRYVEIVAREKACAVPGTPCRSDLCAFAKGYYDRRGDAVRALLQRGAMDADAVQTVGREFQVCPFELSLDAALWADVIIGDYNYLLDPVVRLQRFAADSRMGLLVDECHQLADRARDALSLQLDRRAVKQALAEAPPGSLKKRFEALDRALLALRKREQLGAEQTIPLPESLLASAARVMEALADETIELEAFPASQQLIFTLSRWQRSEHWRDTENFAWFAAAPGNSQVGMRKFKDVQVKMACLDPGPYLAQVFSGYGPHVRFSGTASPLKVYQRLHGLPQATAERVKSLFAPEQLGLFIVPDVSVLYRHRTQSLSTLADLVMQIVSSQHGNYLLALPSFAYLEMLQQELVQRYPRLDIVLQSRGMSESDKDAFLAAFNASSSRLGLVVLGGVFAESVDFSDARLKGVLCVGLGLPPPEPVRDAIANRFAIDESTDGHTVAYQQPAMSKVLQMAGRLLRGPADKGIVCLIDGRYRNAEYQRFFPVHWQPRVIRSVMLGRELENFWRAAPALPQAPLNAEQV